MGARLLADEQFPVKVVYRLRRLGHDVATVREDCESKSGDANPDELILQYAAQQMRTILTLNHRHFKALAARFRGHRGVIGCHADLPGNEMADGIHAAIQSHAHLTGQVIWIGPATAKQVTRQKKRGNRRRSK